MTVNLNTSNLNFNANNTHKCEQHICPKCGQPIADSCDIHSSSQKERNYKKGFWTNAKDKFIAIRKGFIEFGHITLGAAKGSIYGVAAGFATAGVIAVRNIAKKSPQKLGLGGKIIAGAVGISVLAGNIVKAKLDANGEKANLDHRWKSGHNA